MSSYVTFVLILRERREGASTSSLVLDILQSWSFQYQFHYDISMLRTKQSKNFKKIKKHITPGYLDSLFMSPTDMTGETLRWVCLTLLNSCIVYPNFGQQGRLSSLLSSWSCNSDCGWEWQGQICWLVGVWDHNGGAPGGYVWVQVMH